MDMKADQAAGKVVLEGRMCLHGSMAPAIAEVFSPALNPVVRIAVILGYVGFPKYLRPERS